MRKNDLLYNPIAMVAAKPHHSGTRQKTAESEVHRRDSNRFSSCNRDETTSKPYACAFAAPTALIDSWLSTPLRISTHALRSEHAVQATDELNVSTFDCLLSVLQARDSIGLSAAYRADNQALKSVRSVLIRRRHLSSSMHF